MPVQTYCVRDDIEHLMGAAGVVACIDDDEDGIETGDETLHVTWAIERGANLLNSYLIYQYVLSELAGNDWLKDQNVLLAQYYLRMRRNNTPDQHIVDQVNELKNILLDIRWGRWKVPGQLPSFDTTPSVSSLKVEMGLRVNQVRVVPEESTGDAPEGSATRNTSNRWW